MPQVRSGMSLTEFAVLVHGALAAAGITAVFSGGAAVGIHSRGGYRSDDLDFVTEHPIAALKGVLAQLGFVRESDPRKSVFTHPLAPWYLEFPAAPLAFGKRSVGATSRSTGRSSPATALYAALGQNTGWRSRTTAACSAGCNAECGVRGRRRAASMTSTGRPKWSSRRCLIATRSKCEKTGRRTSTNTSASLSARASSRAIEPNSASDSTPLRSRNTDSMSRRRTHSCAGRCDKGWRGAHAV